MNRNSSKNKNKPLPPPKIKFMRAPSNWGWPADNHSQTMDPDDGQDEMAANSNESENGLNKNKRVGGIP